MKQLNTKLMHPADQLVLIIGRIYRSGLTTTSGGNLSIMDDNGDMWITPAGIDKGSVHISWAMTVRAVSARLAIVRIRFIILIRTI